MIKKIKIGIGLKSEFTKEYGGRKEGLEESLR